MRANHVAVVITVVVQVAIGFVWYAEWAFGGIWMNGIGLDPSKMDSPRPTSSRSRSWAPSSSATG